MKNISYYFLILIILLLMLLGCDYSKKAFYQAEEIATKEAYKEFISTNPSSKFVDKAKNRIEEIVFWEQIMSSKTKNLYNNYLKSFSDGLFVSEAKNKIQMIDDYQKVKATDMMESYQKFLRIYPKNIFSKSIDIRMSELKPAEKEFKLIENETNIKYLQNFIKKFDSTGYISPIKKRLDKISLEK